MSCSMRALSLLQKCSRGFLIPKPTQCDHHAEYKSMVSLRLRCSWCYYTYVGGRLAVNCRRKTSHIRVEKTDP
ncbi:hypothetical protein DdX_05956 [Ditylenchus destructor]|uniref:39S ribosomal protein L36, mitochondrial n=1 Tax=Ditylenchus destructor TaxID=166010 RepID=A0AAD4NBH2_9BILA|nr:hypothetical protein DdX_05956 [Ditylenchus destructor]